MVRTVGTTTRGIIAPIIKKGEDGNLHLMDSYIGQLHTLSSQLKENSEITSVFEAWRLPEDSIKLQELSLEYFTKLGSELNKRIVDFLVKDDLVYSILFDEDYYYISETSLGTSNTKLIKVFPGEFNTLKIAPYSISKNDSGEIIIFSILRDSKTAYLGVSKL